jgi:catechol 2,3-dioxygenase-like lactoylglutathione lyase family enzyme
MQAHAAATVLMVTDLERSLRFYLDGLGFEQEFRFGNYVGLKYGPVQIHLSQVGNPSAKPAGSGSLYLFCDEVDEYHRALTAKGIQAEAPPRDYDYGMRDFCVLDPDGNRVGFGAETKQD